MTNAISVSSRSLTMTAGFTLFVWLVIVTTLGVSFVTAAQHQDDDAPGDVITCGSAIKLTHVESSAAARGQAPYYLNSEAKNLGAGSGQQIITVVGDNPASTNTLWWIRGPNDPLDRGSSAACLAGTGQPIKCNEIIRLTHLETMKNLHSHDVKSPLSRQQEVSGFGEGDGIGDNGDDWRVVCTSTSQHYWRREQKVSFQHVDSGKFLGASSTVKFTHQNCGHSCPILNHLESFARSSQDTYGNWFVEAGVHIHH
jgi:dolichyl-phosphate-mannose--protein O-mannosyl transferase